MQNTWGIKIYLIYTQFQRWGKFSCTLWKVSDALCDGLKCLIEAWESLSCASSRQLEHSTWTCLYTLAFLYSLYSLFYTLIYLFFLIHCLSQCLARRSHHPPQSGPQTRKVTCSSHHEKVSKYHPCLLDTYLGYYCFINDYSISL